MVFDVYGTLLVSDSGDIGNTQHRGEYVEQALRNFGQGTPWETLEAGNQEENSVGNKAIALFKAEVERSHALSRKEGVEFPEVQIDAIWHNVLQQLFPTQDSPEQQVFQNISMDFEFKNNPTYPMPGMEKVLKELHANNIPLGIVSNAQFFTPMLLQYFLQADVQTTQTTISESAPVPYFQEDLCVYSYREEVAKPGVQLYQILTEKLQKHAILPEETLYVGNDMLNDIYPANQLGFQTALFAGDKRSLRKREEDPRTKGLEPDWIVTELRDLLQVVKL